MKPRDHLGFVRLESGFFFPIDDAVNSILYRNEIARYANFLEEFDSLQSLLIGDCLVFGSMNHQKRRGLAAEVSIGGAFAEFRQPGFVERLNSEFSLHGFLQRFALEAFGPLDHVDWSVEADDRGNAGIVARADEIHQIPAGRFTHQRDSCRINFVLFRVMLEERYGGLNVVDLGCVRKFRSETVVDTEPGEPAFGEGTEERHNEGGRFATRGPASAVNKNDRGKRTFTGRDVGVHLYADTGGPCKFNIWYDGVVRSRSNLWNREE